VVWTDPRQPPECGGYGGCASVVLHTVTADDQSFSSGELDDDWSFQQTFDEPGEILYHCEVHSSPAKNINNFMNGRITVQGDEEGVFLINSAISDAWFFPDTAGQGFFIIVWEDSKLVFLAWFTYDTERPPEDVMAFLGEPGHRWLTASGPYDGDTANLTIFVTEGGIFDAAEPAASTDQAGDGTMTLEFADCNAGLVNYEIASLGISGEIPIQRIVLENVPLCESLNVPTPDPEPPGFEGITAAHNVVRDSLGVGMPQLVWDPDLAVIAQAWADGCVDSDAPSGLIDHNPNRSSNYPGIVGENVFGKGGGVPPTPQEAVNVWAGEEADYDSDSNTCSSVCGHYTQIVWATTERLGCGISQCSELQFGGTIVCNYSPAGNLSGARPY